MHLPQAGAHAMGGGGTAREAAPAPRGVAHHHLPRAPTPPLPLPPTTTATGAARRSRAAWLPRPPRALPPASSSQDDRRAQPLAKGACVSVDQFSQLEWRRATVIANEAVNLSGTYRLLRLSVPDDVPRLSGRRIEGVASAARWVDAHTSPGQLVGLRLPGEDGEGAGGGTGAGVAGPPGPRLYPLACSPYESRRGSAGLGACLIEVAVERGAAGGGGGGGGAGPAAAGAAARGAHEARLAELGPGAEVDVSGVVGRGFASMFSSGAGLPQALEDARPLLLVASGLRGAALMRAALSWTPVQAHATAAGVAAYYVDASAAGAAFVSEWEAWREAGVRFRPLFLRPPGEEGEEGGGHESGGGARGAEPGAAEGEGGGGGGGGDAAAIASLIEQALFLQPGGLAGALGGSPQEATALLAGLPGKAASAVSRELSYKGLPRDRLLFVDFM